MFSLLHANTYNVRRILVIKQKAVSVLKICNIAQKWANTNPKASILIINHLGVKAFSDFLIKWFYLNILIEQRFKVLVYRWRVWGFRNKICDSRITTFGPHSITTAYYPDPTKSGAYVSALVILVYIHNSNLNESV